MSFKFVAVIGRGNEGKSTIVSSLTGCRSSNFIGFMIDKVTNRSIHVCCASPQERSTIGLTTIRRWIQSAHKTKGCSGMVMAMQPTKPRKRISIEDTIKEALAANMDVYAFVLEPGYRSANASDYQKVSARLTAIGVNSLRIFPLDGRQFAIHSANAINSMAQVF